MGCLGLGELYPIVGILVLNLFARYDVSGDGLATMIWRSKTDRHSFWAVCGAAGRAIIVRQMKPFATSKFCPPALCANQLPCSEMRRDRPFVYDLLGNVELDLMAASPAPDVNS